MKKIFTGLCSLLIMISSLQATKNHSTKSGTVNNQPRQEFASDKVFTPKATLVEEGFEGTTLPPLGWTTTDADADGYNWRYNPECVFHGGAQAITSDSYLNDSGGVVLTPNNFLITPAISIPAGSAAGNVNYWVCAQDAAWAGEHYAVAISTTGTAPEDFTTILFEETLTAKEGKPSGAWYERNVTIPVTYAGQTVYIAFRHFNSTNMFAMDIDDVKITAGPDTDAPTVATPTGIAAIVGTAMTVQTVVSDETGIASVVGHYKLAGQSTWTDFAMTASKYVTGTYTGIIPVQTTDITGLVKFTTTDTVTPANTGDSPETAISWKSEPATKWMEWGETYDPGSGIGVPSAAWWGGVDFDFGSTTNWNLTAVKLGVSTAISVPWNIKTATQTDATTITLGNTIASGIINCSGVSDIVPTIATLSDSTTTLTGHIAIVFDMPAAGYISFDEDATSAHTYFNIYNDGSITLLTSLIGDLPGAWLAGIRVRNTTGIESVEILPGKSELSQNYPNPFNPTTSINFFNNMTGNVKLSVMNAKGETVATLVNNSVVAGSHKVDFNGATFNSGVYFYKLETPTATITKKMLLVK